MKFIITTQRFGFIFLFISVILLQEANIIGAKERPKKDQNIEEGADIEATEYMNSRQKKEIGEDLTEEIQNLEIPEYDDIESKDDFDWIMKEPPPKKKKFFKEPSEDSGMLYEQGKVKLKGGAQLNEPPQKDDSLEDIKNKVGVEGGVKIEY